MRSIFWWRRSKELDDEIRSHFEMAVRERIERGEDPRRAREAAQREFGNAGLVRETTRDAWGWRHMEQFAHDARYTLRLLRKNPAFTLIAVLTLALGIGANAVIFSVINGLYLHPKGMPDPSHVFTIRVNYTKLNLRNIVISPPDFRDVRDSRQIFSSTAAEDQGSMTFPGPGGPVRVETAQITWEWFKVFNARPLMGRVFSPEEDQPHANQEAILSYAAWQNLFGGDPEILGKTINLNRADYRIVGVMGPDFDWPRRTEVWIPMGMAPESFADDNYFNEALFVVARARPDVTPAQAEAYVQVLTHRLIASHPETTYPSDSGWGMAAIPLTEYASGDLRAPMLILLVAVGFLLLIACSNIGGLMLAKSAARTKEFAVRVALGAGRSDLLRQAITEGFLLTAIGAVVGVGAAYLGLDALIRIAPGNLPLRLHPSLDGHVLAFAVLLTMIAGIFLGLVPLSHVFSQEQADVLRSDARSFTASHGRQRLRQLLVIGQVALALVLLIGAGLMLKSLGKISQINPGFEPQGVMTASVQLPEEKYNSDEKQIVFYRSVADRLAGLPGVESAALALPIPFSGFAPSSSFSIENRPMAPGDPGPHSDLSWVSPQFFAALRIPLLQGRYFTDQDSARSLPVVIVDDNLARQYWPNENAVGNRLRRGNNSPWATIVGVVGHVMLTSLAGDSGKGVCYYPLFQQPVSQAFLIVKTRTDPARLGPSIRSAVAAVDAGQPVDSLESMDDYVSSSLGPQQISVSLLGTFSVLALFLSALGLYGVISYEFAQRTREIGIRMSLGAQRQEVWRLVVAEGMRLALAGVLAGALGAALLARYLASELYGVSALDPATFAWTSLVLAAIALMACLVPAVRATRVDPIVALRYE
jgi:predicted permease